MTIGLITKLAKVADKLLNDAGIRADLSSFVGASYVKYRQSGLNAITRAVQDKINETISVGDFGAVSGLAYTGGLLATANTLSIQSAVDALPRGSKLVIPSGQWVINKPIVIAKGYVSLEWVGELVAADDFVGDYMVKISPGGNENFYRWPLKIVEMSLSCRYKTRGLYGYSMDHIDLRGVRVQEFYGRGIMLDRTRESALWFPTLVNGQHRENFPTPVDYNPATLYGPGNYTRIVDPAWDVLTPYVRDQIVRDGADRYICLTPSTGSQPSLFPISWKQIPHEDYLCVVANTGMQPQVNNTNNVTVANRVWQKVYQDEAAIEIVDYLVDGGDRTNQVVLTSPIVRDCGNKCFFRIDSSKLPGRPVTHLDVFGGHFHGLAGQQAGIVPQLPIPDLQRCIEIGYAINTNIYASNIRAGDGKDCIPVMYGDGSTTKVAQDLRLHNCAISGDGQNDLGILVMPSVQASLSSSIDVSFLMTHATSNNLHDPRRIFRRTFRTEARMLLPSGLNGVVGGYTVLGPLGGYADVRPYSYQVDGETSTRYDVQVTTNRTTVRVGGGDNSYLELQWNVGNPNRLSIAPGKEAAVAGTWDAPFLLGSLRLWNNAGALFSKNGTNPTSITDGTAV